MARTNAPAGSKNSKSKGKGKEVADGALVIRDQGEREVSIPNDLGRKRARPGGKSKAPKAPTPSQRRRKLEAMTWEQTRWADHQFLRDLGLHEDVETMFRHMGLLGLFNMQHVGYKEETIQFLSTMTFHDDTSLDASNENRGLLKFKIHGKDHEMTIAQLGMTFNFPTGGDAYSLSVDVQEAQSIWRGIADGKYQKGKSKASKIRNPSIRYAHKLLANTLFARRETGAVKEEEMALLIEGIKRYMTPTPTGLPKRVDFARYLARRLQSYQEWAFTTNDKTPMLNIGGLITPILLACHAEIRPQGESATLALMDREYLSSIHFIVGRTKRAYAYRFEIDGVKKTMLLPNTAATLIHIGKNIHFRPLLFYLYNPATDGPISQASRKRKPEDQPQEFIEEESPEEVIGSHRYDFKLYSEPIVGEALMEAHRQIGLLQRALKWSNKNVRKLTKTVKGLKKMLSQRGSQSGNPEEANPTLALTLTQEDGGAESSMGRGNKRKAPISPSSSDSGNPCYSMGSSSDNSPSHDTPSPTF